ncbi:hypothetical protein Glove_590g19 [Diversispora epigaea]|uniref:Uncharacterized protein n=1 Tax=Diversispora epigaea TaxID=1348612 RepID=A0A397GAP1_9GLOM|nr:hypothetical protein Glove_590g19 [Diversispora epigaea]
MPCVDSVGVLTNFEWIGVGKSNSIICYTAECDTIIFDFWLTWLSWFTSRLFTLRPTIVLILCIYPNITLKSSCHLLINLKKEKVKFLYLIKSSISRPLKFKKRSKVPLLYNDRLLSA